MIGNIDESGCVLTPTELKAMGIQTENKPISTMPEFIPASEVCIEKTNRYVLVLKDGRRFDMRWYNGDENSNYSKLNQRVETSPLNNPPSLLDKNKERVRTAQNRP